MIHQRRAAWCGCALIAMAITALMAAGCSDRRGAPETVGASEGASKVSGESGVNAILEAWPRREPPPANVVERFVELAHQTSWESSLRVSELSEEWFASSRLDQREEVMDRLLAQFGQLRRLARAALERAEALREEGDVENARRCVEAVRRAGRANASNELNELSRMVGESLLDLISEYEQAERR